jgi:hypothetical protein
MKQYPTQKQIKALLDYNPLTGSFIWKQRPFEAFKKGIYQERDWINWNKRYAGTPAGCLNSDGYVAIRINGVLCWGHRVAYIYMYGSAPKNDIDHINRNTIDNRIVNLRDVYRSQNMQNSALQQNNSSGVRGVSFNRQRDKWESYITLDTRRRRLGLFKDFDDAVKARYEAEIKYGFTEMNEESTAFTHLQAVQL